MRVKGIIILVIVLALVAIEGYLIVSSVLGKVNQDKDVQTYCAVKCGFNQNTSYWEFSGENGTKGFTTEEECFNYCSKFRMGFIGMLQKYNSDFIGALSNIFQK